MNKRLLLMCMICICVILSGCAAESGVSVTPSELLSDTPTQPTPELLSDTPTQFVPKVTAPKPELFVKINGCVGNAGILFDGKGCMLVGTNEGIIKITPNGEVSEFVSFTGITAVKDYAFKSPLAWDMVMDNEGNILAAAQDRILKITEKGDIETIIEGQFDGFVGISGLELDTEGNLYFTSGSRIVKYSPGGGQQVWFDGSSFDLNSFFSLRFDPVYGSLYATDFNTRTLVKIPVDAEGGAAEPEIIVKEPIKKAKPYGAPLNMVFGKDGNLYSSLDAKASVLKVYEDGSTEIIPMNSFYMNHYIAFGGEGFEQDCVYFTVYQGTGIYKFRLVD